MKELSINYSLPCFYVLFILNLDFVAVVKFSKIVLGAKLHDKVVNRRWTQ